MDKTKKLERKIQKLEAMVAKLKRQREADQAEIQRLKAAVVYRPKTIGIWC